MKELAEFKIEPAFRLQNGRTIRNAADAIALLREHETRPGVDDRDEVLHQLERAQNDDERAQAVERFRAWLMTWGSIPVATNAGSTQGPG